MTQIVVAGETDGRMDEGRRGQTGEMFTLVRRQENESNEGQTRRPLGPDGASLPSESALGELTALFLL